MHHTKTLGHAIVLSMALASTAASAATAEAWIDWSSLEITLVDLDPDDGVTPSLMWFYQTSNTSLDGATREFADAFDWTTPLDSTNPGAAVHLDASTLSATIDSAALTTATNAVAVRAGYFELSPNTQVVISANASVALTPGQSFSFASAHFELFEVPSSPSSPFDMARLELGMGSGSGTAAVGVLSVSISNTSSNVAEGALVASADTLLSPVPEPESYALFLAGLGLIGLLARRPRMQ